jgi:hypothetical protein
MKTWQDGLKGKKYRRKYLYLNLTQAKQGENKEEPTYLIQLGERPMGMAQAQLGAHLPTAVVSRASPGGPHQGEHQHRPSSA